MGTICVDDFLKNFILIKFINGCQVIDFFLLSEMSHRFSLCCGKNIAIKNNGCTACRVRNFNHGLVFSADPLKSDEIFEVSLFF